jgi:hypothetical protein
VLAAVAADEDDARQQRDVEDAEPDDAIADVGG